MSDVLGIYALRALDDEFIHSTNNNTNENYENKITGSNANPNSLLLSENKEKNKEFATDKVETMENNDKDIDDGSSSEEYEEEEQEEEEEEEEEDNSELGNDVNGRLMDLREAVMMGLAANGTWGRLRAQLRACTMGLLRGDHRLITAAFGQSQHEEPLQEVVSEQDKLKEIQQKTFHHHAQTSKPAPILASYAEMSSVDTQATLLLIRDFMQRKGLVVSAGVLESEAGLDVINVEAEKLVEAKRLHEQLQTATTSVAITSEVEHTKANTLLERIVHKSLHENHNLNDNNANESYTNILSENRNNNIDERIVNEKLIATSTMSNNDNHHYGNSNDENREVVDNKLLATSHEQETNLNTKELAEVEIKSSNLDVTWLIEHYEPSLPYDDNDGPLNEEEYDYIE